MRKLTAIETGALAILNREGSILLDDSLEPIPLQLMTHTMNELVKKKRAAVEATEVGPRYKPLRHD